MNSCQVWPLGLAMPWWPYHLMASLLGASGYSEVPIWTGSQPTIFCSQSQFSRMLTAQASIWSASTS